MFATKLLSSFVCLILLSGTRMLYAETWTLERALRTAQAQNPDVKIAQHRIESAEALLAQAQAAWLPQIMVQGGYTQTNASMAAFGSILNQRAFSFALDFNHPGRIDDLQLRGTVGYNIYAGGRATAGRDAARAGTKAAEKDLKAYKNYLAAEVTKAYLSLRKARKAVEAIEAGVKAYEVSLLATRARFDAGQVLKSDLLSLEVQLAETREKYSSAKHGARLAERAFHFLLGSEDPKASVEMAETDPLLDTLAYPPSLEGSQRPELLGLQDRLRAAEKMVDLARGGRRPTINAFASYQYDHGWQLKESADGWMAGLSVELSLFDGGQTGAKIRQALAELSQVREMQRKASLGIALEIEQARLAHEDAKKRLEVSELTVAQAEESAQLSRERFEKGALLAAELIGAETRLIETRMRRTHAAADERLFLADLHRAVGLSLLDTL